MWLRGMPRDELDVHPALTMPIRRLPEAARAPATVPRRVLRASGSAIRDLLRPLVRHQPAGAACHEVAVALSAASPHQLGHCLLRDALPLLVACERLSVTLWCRHSPGSDDDHNPSLSLRLPALRAN